ncbi:MAG: hypothetical protein IT280_06290 [Ignavibacteria bacterium]|nr:hypothetical protein [Ignavibacteria bacterium]
MKTKTTVNKISQSNLEQCIKYAECGITFKQIENLLGLSAGTLKSYAVKYPEYKRAFENAELIVQAKIEQALIKRALGYETSEIHIIYTKSSGSTNENQDDEEIQIFEDGLIKPEELGMKVKEIRKVYKIVPPDNSAILSYLINRNSKRWSKNPAPESGKSIEDMLEDRKTGLKQATDNM